MKKIRAIFFLCALFPLSCYADVLVLKNGMRIDSEQIWKENGEIKCNVKGVILGFPEKDVLRIERTDTQRAAQSETHPEGSASGVTGTTRADLEHTKKELEKEYRLLLEEMERLSQNKQKAVSAAEVRKHIDDVSRYNQKVAGYEKKRRAYIDAARVVDAEKQAANRKSIDPGRFEQVIATWVGKPLSGFVDQWGAPDKAFDMPGGRQAHLFVIEISPTQRRHVYFTTDASGKITSYGKTKP